MLQTHISRTSPRKQPFHAKSWWIAYVYGPGTLPNGTKSQTWNLWMFPSHAITIIFDLFWPIRPIPSHIMKSMKTQGGHVGRCAHLPWKHPTSHLVGPRAQRAGTWAPERLGAPCSIQYLGIRKGPLTWKRFEPTVWGWLQTSWRPFLAETAWVLIRGSFKTHGIRHIK